MELKRERERERWHKENKNKKERGTEKFGLRLKEQQSPGDETECYGHEQHGGTKTQSSRCTVLSVEEQVCAYLTSLGLQSCKLFSLIHNPIISL